MFRLNMDDLVNRIRPYFRSQILKRGWEYYLNHSVDNLETEGKSVITATVYGTTVYRVRMDLDSFPSRSNCSCPYGDSCKHMAAVLFEACGLAGLQPKQLLSPGIHAAISRTASEQKSGSSSLPDRQKNITKSPVTVPKATESVKEWHRYFAKQVSKHPYYRAYYLDMMYEKFNKGLLLHAKHWSPTIQRIYHLHVQLFILKQFDQFYQKHETNYYAYYDSSSVYRNVSARVVEEIVQLVRELNQEEAYRFHQQHLLETADFLAEYAIPDHYSPVNWSFLYRYLWANLLHYEPWVESERHRLQSELRNKQLHPIYRDGLIKGRMHFELMDGNDRTAMAIADNELSDKDPADFLGYLHSFYSLQQWDRLVDWLRWMIPMIKQSGQNYINVYLSYWKAVGQQQDFEDEGTAVMIELLPESYSFYANYLIEQQRYREWVDLNLLSGFTPFEVESVELKAVESNDIRLLLPLYHQSVERLIREKNRDSYRQAVRLLKKLDKHYRKLKEQERWRGYLQYLSKRYARYRAFQEELRKGKLIG